MLFLEQQQNKTSKIHRLGHIMILVKSLYTCNSSLACSNNFQLVAQAELSKSKRHKTIKVSIGTEGNSADGSCGTRGLHRVTLVQQNTSAGGTCRQWPVNHMHVITCKLLLIGKIK